MQVLILIQLQHVGQVPKMLARLQACNQRPHIMCVLLRGTYGSRLRGTIQHESHRQLLIVKVFNHKAPSGAFLLHAEKGAVVNEPSAQLWKKLNEVSDKLQKVTEQLVEANTLNKGYHAALEQMRVKVELLEQQKFKDQGAISMLKWGLGFVLGVAISGGTWTINSINQLKQDMAIMQSHREDSK